MHFIQCVCVLPCSVYFSRRSYDHLIPYFSQWTCFYITTILPDIFLTTILPDIFLNGRVFIYFRYYFTLESNPYTILEERLLLLLARGSREAEMIGRRMGTHHGNDGAEAAQATRVAWWYGGPAREGACRISLSAGKKMLVLAVAGLCIQPGSASLAHDRRGPGARAAQRMQSGHIPHSTPSPVSSPAASGMDLTSMKFAATPAAAQRQARSGPAKGLRRTASYRSGLSAAAEVSVRDGSARLGVTAASPRKDCEYRARGDSKSEVFTQLQTGLFPHLNFS